MDLIRLENEIKLLLRFRLSEYDYDLAVVEAYMAMDRSIMCRIELFKEQWIVEMRVAKYEAPVREGFYFEAEQYLIGNLSKNLLLDHGRESEKTITGTESWLL